MTEVTQRLNDYSDADWSNRLLNATVEIQAAFIEESDIGRSFGRMLDCLLELTDSEYGFLGEVLFSKTNQPYLVTHALTDISWDAETKAIYDANMAKGFEFHNLNTLFGVTLATGETVISNDPDNDPRSGGLPTGHPGMRSYLGVPIKHRDTMLGMLGIANRRGGYQAEIVDALRPLLITAGSMIQSMRNLTSNKIIEDELQQKHKLLLGVIHNISDALIITDHRGVISEVNTATEKIFGYYSQELLGRNIGMCLSAADAVAYDKSLKEFLLTGNHEIFRDRRESSGLTKKQQLIPVELAVSEIKLGHSKLFVHTLRDITERKSQENMIAEANKILQELSESDELTGLYNRRYIEKRLREEFNRSRQTPCEMGLALVDIDHFKAYNDNYGHPKGDKCLSQFGRILANYFRRDCECAGRIGGEEFAIVMTHMSEQDCVTSLEGLMDAVAKEAIQHEFSVTGHLSVSIGLAMRTAATQHPDEMYAQADKALYMAKENGRNKLVAFSE
jgi:diguanylate cyclase (GGDEF)-like protein/PAS domain S-box-containing protein